MNVSVGGKADDMIEEITDRTTGPAWGAAPPVRPDMRISVLLIRPDGTTASLGSRPTDDRRPHSLANVCRASSLVRGNLARVGAGDRLRVRLDVR